MLTFFQGMFSDNGSPSSSRFITAILFAAGAFCLVHLVLHNHALPSPTDMAGLASFCIAPYATNTALNVLKK